MSPDELLERNLDDGVKISEFNSDYKSYWESLEKANYTHGEYQVISGFDNLKNAKLLNFTIEEKDLVKSFDTSTEALSELWKERYARKRITNLVKNDRTNLTETLFYDDVCFMSWAETKEKYLGEVGR